MWVNTVFYLVFVNSFRRTRKSVVGVQWRASGAAGFSWNWRRYKFVRHFVPFIVVWMSTWRTRNCALGLLAFKQNGNFWKHYKPLHPCYGIGSPGRERTCCYFQYRNRNYCYFSEVKNSVRKLDDGAPKLLVAFGAPSWIWLGSPRYHCSRSRNPLRNEPHYIYSFAKCTLFSAFRLLMEVSQSKLQSERFLGDPPFGRKSE